MILDERSLEIKDEKKYLANTLIAAYGDTWEVWDEKKADIQYNYFVEIDIYSATKESPARVKQEICFSYDGSYWTATTLYSHNSGQIAISTTTGTSIGIVLTNNDGSYNAYMNGFIAVKRVKHIAG